MSRHVIGRARAKATACGNDMSGSTTGGPNLVSLPASMVPTKTSDP